MLANEITSIVGGHKRKNRLGRGSAGKGKTCGRGHKGCGSRAGFSARPAYEGGRMPLFRRLPKRGFSNFNFERRYEIVNISDLDRFEEGTLIDIVQLAGAGLVQNRKSKVKILGNGQLTKKFEVIAHRFSKSAQRKITGCGGKTKVVA